MRDRFVLICLVMMVLLLAVTACRQGLMTANAAAPKEYKVVHITCSMTSSDSERAAGEQRILNQQVKEGWELVEAPSTSCEGFLIFKK